MSYLTEEIASQPGCWSKAIETAGSAETALPRPGERVAAVGCGSSLSDECTVVWVLGAVPADLLADARRTGATVIAPDTDPLAGLIGAQRLAAVLAVRKGIDPDQPRALSRSVIIS